MKKTFGLLALPCILFLSIAATSEEATKPAAIPSLGDQFEQVRNYLFSSFHERHSIQIEGKVEGTNTRCELYSFTNGRGHLFIQLRSIDSVTNKPIKQFVCIPTFYNGRSDDIRELSIQKNAVSIKSPAGAWREQSVTLTESDPKELKIKISDTHMMLTSDLECSFEK